MKSMSDPEKKITREELHRLVWTRTFVRLAKELGYNHPELAAICEDLNIPRPAGGYWYRLEHGQAEAQVPLPPVPPGKPTEIPRGPRKAREESSADAAATPAQLNPPEQGKSVTGGKIEAESDAAGKKQDAQLIPSTPSSIEPPSPALDSTSQDRIRVTRKELYQKVWNMSLVKLVAELGTTYVELVRVCEELKVPRPDRDYWSRLQFNLPVEVIPLPDPETGMAIEGLLWRKGSRRQKPVVLAEGHHSETGHDAPVASVAAVAAEESQAVDKPVKVEYTREQLHEAIWSKPCVKLAAELGISDVALAKTCRRMGIPRPPRGYWARVEAGEKIKREPLPAAKPGQNPNVTFYVAANVARREEWAANNILTTAHIVKCGAVELPSEGSELHPIAEKHRQALLKAKPGELGFVTVQGKDLFACELSAAMVPRLMQAVHALVCELEDRDYEFNAGENKDDGLQIVRDKDRVTLNWSEAKLELEREPTAADKRKPSWTWQLKETKPAGNLTVEVSAWGLKGKRKWTENDGRSLEEVLGVVVEKVEAVFRGHEDRRKREAERARQRAEEDKREAEAEAIEAEKEAREEKARKERERVKRHEKKLEEIAEQRSDNLASATQEWIEMQGMLAYVQYCQEGWRRAGSGTLSKEQTEWLAWARLAAEKMGPTGYPDPSRDGSFDANAVPVGGPYPETRKWERDESEESQPPEVKPPVYQPPTPEPFPYWLMHRHR
jgi:hypothetical protein